ncbi:MAG: hypothetical protein ACE5I3_15100 [Phycisphaerae bacterium]
MAHEQHPNPNVQDDPSAMPVIITGVAGSLLVVVTIIVLLALYHRTESALIRERVYDAPSIAVEQLHADQEAKLNVPGWIDREEGIVAIPIEDAIRRVTRELAASQDGTGPWSPRPDERSPSPSPTDDLESQPSNADTPDRPSPDQPAESPGRP